VRVRGNKHCSARAFGQQALLSARVRGNKHCSARAFAATSIAQRARLGNKHRSARAFAATSIAQRARSRQQALLSARVRGAAFFCACKGDGSQRPQSVHAGAQNKQIYSFFNLRTLAADTAGELDVL